MKIVSWNVNGLRACYKKGFLENFKKINADVFCIQELRAQEDELPEELKKIPGYFSFFNPSKLKKGHSGTAVYCKIKPEEAEYSMGFEKFDQEGRVIKLKFKDFILFNFYFPQGGRGKENLDYKLEVYNFLIDYFNQKKSSRHSRDPVPTGRRPGSCPYGAKPRGESANLLDSSQKIILIGDFNIAHKEIDLARPKENQNNIMFTPQERKKIDGLIKIGFLDSFRIFDNKGENYTFWPYFRKARERNLGWRIDYSFISFFLKEKVKKAYILPEITGSDHCPVGIELIS